MAGYSVVPIRESTARWCVSSLFWPRLPQWVTGCPQDGDRARRVHPKKRPRHWVGVVSGSGHKLPPALFRERRQSGKVFRELPAGRGEAPAISAAALVQAHIPKVQACGQDRPIKEVQIELGEVMNFTKLIGFLLLATSLSFSALAQSLPIVGKPDGVSFPAERLKRLTDTFQSDVDKGAIPGAVVLIARDGKVAYFEAFGFQDTGVRLICE
jgi:hypothetical protein